MKDTCIVMPFGDVKDGGRITIRTDIGDRLAVVKIQPIAVDIVHNAGQYKLSADCHDVTPLSAYNVMHKGDNGLMNYFFLKPEVMVEFFTDF